MLKDIAKLGFKRGVIGGNKNDEENSYISLLRRGLDYFGMHPGSGGTIFTGPIQFSSYGQGTITGTVAYTLAVDSDGNIIETTGGGGSLPTTPNYGVIALNGAGVPTAYSSLLYDGSDLTLTGGNIVTSNLRAGVSGTYPQGLSNFGSDELFIGDWGDVVNGNKFYLGEGSSISYFDNIAHDIKVGINTSTPTEALDVHGNIQTDGNLILSSYGSGTHTGTPTYGLSVDAGGNVIETTGGTPGISDVLLVGQAFTGDRIMDLDGNRFRIKSTTSNTLLDLRPNSNSSFLGSTDISSGSTSYISLTSITGSNTAFQLFSVDNFSVLFKGDATAGTIEATAPTSITLTSPLTTITGDFKNSILGINYFETNHSGGDWASVGTFGSDSYIAVDNSGVNIIQSAGEWTHTGNTDITGTLDVTGLSTLGTTHVTDELTVDQNSNFNANIIVSMDATANNLISNGDISGANLAGTGTRIVTADPSGVLGATNGFESGTYTPTLSNTTNVTSSTPIICHYIRLGNEVTVTGSVGIVTTLAVSTVLGISLPIASNFAVTTDAAGIGQASTAIGTNAIVQANTTTDIAELRFIGLSVGGNGTLFFSFTYTII